MSGPYLREVEVHSEITSACIRFLLTCKVFVTATVDVETSARVVRGFHDLFPYVHEYWMTHLTFMLEKPRQLVDSDSRHRLHKLLQGLAALIEHPDPPSATDGLQGVDPALIRTPNNDLRGSQTALPVVIKEYLSYRATISANRKQVTTDSDDSSEVTASDPTFLTNAYNHFMDAFETLLNGDCPHDHRQLGVCKEKIEEFKSRHGASAYLCRWRGCVWASTGFRTEEERANHERSHKTYYRCPEPDCDNAVGRFSSRQALQRHKEKYHTRVEDISLPQFPLQESKGSLSHGQSLHQRQTQLRPEDLEA
jgi:hypothetical protein